jgi:hypothetical protein
MLLEQIGGHMRADVSGPTGQEYRHVAPFVPVFMHSPFSVGAPLPPLKAGAQTGARASSGRPSISG